MIPGESERIAEGRRDFYWPYVVADCETTPRPQVIKDPAELSWHEIKKVGYFWLSVGAMREPVRVREDPSG